MVRRSRGETQQLILNYIIEQTQTKGYPPSVREIGEAVGLKSTSTVHGHLCRLEQKGLLQRAPMKPRAIDASVNFALKDDVRSVPIYNRISVGTSLIFEKRNHINNSNGADDGENENSSHNSNSGKGISNGNAANTNKSSIDADNDSIQLPKEMIGHDDCFVLVVHDNSMIKAGIMDGDYVVVCKQSDAQNGDIVVVLLDGTASVKRFFRERGHFRLQPENSTMRPIITKKVTLLGKVTASYRLL